MSRQAFEAMPVEFHDVWIGFALIFVYASGAKNFVQESQSLRICETVS